MKRAWTIAHIAFVALLIVIGYLAVTCVAIAIFRANVKPQDFWTAVGVPVNALVAIGTFGAAGVALWVSKDQRRQQKDDEVTRANLSAAGAVPKLESAIWKTGTASMRAASAVINLNSTGQQTLESLRENVQHANAATDCLQGIPYLDFDEIRSLVALPEQCAIQTEAAQGRLRAAIADFHEIKNRYSQLVDRVNATTNNRNIDNEFNSMFITFEAKYQTDLFNNSRERLTEAEVLLNNAVRVCKNHSRVIDQVIASSTSNTP
ncbi:hypothetical protein [Burkholderia cenocepacia]|uniref:hypothetical protein n=1 Tax=Burkholderia cenocepacia TaxID=95486 RepID=UPI002AB046B9|nr:hypothetical protein [Burkholderia cenocepacia]